MEVYLLHRSQEQDYSLFFTFVPIVPGTEQELDQYLPVADGDGGGSDVESTVNRSTAKRWDILFLDLKQLWRSLRRSSSDLNRDPRESQASQDWDFWYPLPEKQDWLII